MAVNTQQFADNQNLPFKLQLNQRSLSPAADHRSVLSLTRYKERHCQLDLAGDTKAEVPPKTLDKARREQRFKVYRPLEDEVSPFGLKF